jgi:hypothetical protein
MIVKEIRACITCGKLSTPKYANQFTKDKSEYQCKACTNKSLRIQHKIICNCIDCGKPSSLRYPSQFKCDPKEYRCRSCCNKIQSKDPKYLELLKIAAHKRKVPNVIWNCVDCGKSSTPKKACKFNQTKENYRCLKCSLIKVTKSPSWIENNKNAMKQNPKNPLWVTNQKIAATKRSQDPVWLANQKVGGKKRMDNPLWKINKRNGIINKYDTDQSYRENLLILHSGQGFWYGHPILHPETKRKKYCELWNKDLWVRIDVAWDYKSAYSQKTRWDNYRQQHLDRHHVYWQEKACCEWDEDAQGYFAMINNGTKAKPDMIKHYIKGDPNKFVLLTHDEHTMVRGSKKSGKDKMYWVKYFEELILKREAEGKPCYLSKEEYEVYKMENAEKIAYYTKKPQSFTKQPTETFKC